MFEGIFIKFPCNSIQEYAILKNFTKLFFVEQPPILPVSQFEDIATSFEGYILSRKDPFWINF